MKQGQLMAQLITMADSVAASIHPFLATYFPPTDEASGGFYQICSVLADAAIENYGMLRSSLLNNDQKLCALACRNLLEVRVFTTYVLRSAVNAKILTDDRLIDGFQIAQAMRDLELELNPQLSESQFDKRVEEFRTKQKSEGVDRKTYMSTSVMAEAIGFKIEYKRMNSLCSKLIHPTAWSLFTAELGTERFPDACPLFFSQGGVYLTTIQSELLDHIRNHGLSYSSQAIVKNVQS